MVLTPNKKKGEPNGKCKLNISLFLQITIFHVDTQFYLVKRKKLSLVPIISVLEK